MLRRSEVLDEAFTPSDVVHRHQELSQLATALEPLADGEPANTAFLFGPTGVGKTVTCRYVLSELEREQPAVGHVLVNCWSNYSRRRVASSVLDAVAPANRCGETTAVDTLLSRVRDAIRSPLVVVLDEADQLADDSIIYDLHRIPNVSLVLIANREEELFAHLDDRVHSRLSAGVSIYYDAYCNDELEGILGARVALAFSAGAVSDDVVAAIAERAAGDARTAIQILKEAGRLAQSEGAGSLDYGHVERAAPRARSAIREDTLEQLTEHQRALYDVLAEDGPLGMRELFDAYEARVADVKTKRTVRRQLSKMEHYDLVVSNGDRSGTTYDVVE